MLIIIRQAGGGMPRGHRGGAAPAVSQLGSQRFPAGELRGRRGRVRGRCQGTHLEKVDTGFERPPRQI